MRAYPFLFLLIPSVSFAWVCPNNFNQIVPGDTIDQVVKQCGKPQSKNVTEKTPMGPQEWQYFITPKKSVLPAQNELSQVAGASVKLSVALIEGKVINIAVQGSSLSSTTLCGPTIKVGDSFKSVERNCGKPTFIQRQESERDTKPLEVIEYKYNTAPPNTLIFENGRLKEHK